MYFISLVLFLTKFSCLCSKEECTFAKYIVAMLNSYMTSGEEESEKIKVEEK